MPCTFGTEFLDKHVEAIFTLLKKVLWQNDVGDVTRNLRRASILATLRANNEERSWEDERAKVRACGQVRVTGRMKECMMATWATPGLVAISHISCLCRNKQVAAARGVALFKPAEPFLVKVCNFGPEQAITRTNSILGFAEPFQELMLAAKTEENKNPRQTNR